MRKNMVAHGSSQKRGLWPLLPCSWLSGSFFTLPSTMTDGVQTPPALWPVQRTVIVTAQKHDCRDTPATWKLEDPCFLDRESVCWASVFSARVVIWNFLKNQLPFGEAFLNCPSPTFLLGYHHETPVCWWELSFNWMHLWIRMKH